MWDQVIALWIIAWVFAPMCCEKRKKYSEYYDYDYDEDEDFFSF